MEASSPLDMLDRRIVTASGRRKPIGLRWNGLDRVVAAVAGAGTAAAAWTIRGRFMFCFSFPVSRWMRKDMVYCAGAASVAEAGGPQVI
jgi:hypothetical protein